MISKNGFIDQGEATQSRHYYCSMASFSNGISFPKTKRNSRNERHKGHRRKGRRSNCSLFFTSDIRNNYFRSVRFPVLATKMISCQSHVAYFAVTCENLHTNAPAEVKNSKLTIRFDFLIFMALNLYRSNLFIWKR